MSKSGAKQKDVIEQLAIQGHKFKRICLVVGSSDCDDSNRTTASVMEERHMLLDEAKKYAEKVIVSSLLPRDNPNTQCKIDLVNRATKDTCICNSDPCLDYVCNDGYFKLADQSQNEAMFVNDGVHPTYCGASKLLHNLGLHNDTQVKRWMPPQSTMNHHPILTQQPPPRSMWMNRSYSRHPSSYHPGTMFAPACVWCHSNTHMASDCPNRRNRCCYRCGSTAHSARWCSI